MDDRGDWHQQEEERRRLEAELMDQAGGNALAAVKLAQSYISEWDQPYEDEESA